MYQSQLFPKTRKEFPREAESINHKLLVKAGFVDQLMTGSWTLLPLGWRVVEKINNIIREEMNAIGGQEMLMPLLHPKAIWNETGRWEKAREVMYQFKDLRGREFALSFKLIRIKIYLWLFIIFRRNSGMNPEPEAEY
jgi:prolyl-tRNA synthetase